MISDADILYLTTALELAERGMFSTTPNPRVGCLIVRGHQVLGRGWHIRHGEGHAEVNAIADAKANGHLDLKGTTVYVSLEPCAFASRTPACTDALIAEQVGRVVSGLRDPHVKVSGRGYALLRAAGITVDTVEMKRGRELNAGYLRRVSESRPFVRVKAAISLDGRTAMADGTSQWITGTDARTDVQYWRARSCAILTGVGTVTTDDCRLTVRDERYAVEGKLRQPMRVLVDSQCRAPAAAQLFAMPETVRVAHVKDATPKVADVEHWEMGAGPQVDLPQLVSHLASEGVNELWVEAGPTLTGAIVEQSLWDELLIYIAPKLMGSRANPLAYLELDAMEQLIDATLIECEPIGTDLRLRLARSG